MPHHRSWPLLTAAALCGLSFSIPARVGAQDTQSVAEAARRAPEQKKNAAKPVREVNDDNLVRTPATAASSTPAAPGTGTTAGPGNDEKPCSAEAAPATPPNVSPDALPTSPPAPAKNCSPAAAQQSTSTADSNSQSSAASASSAPADSNSPASAAKPAANSPVSPELAALTEEVKQAQQALELVQRERALQQDTYYSNPDYVHDTAGKAKLDALQQQVNEKQEAFNALKARLALEQAKQVPPKSTVPQP
jgi:hypothetical protein